MCGLVYAHNFAGEPVNNGILQQFDEQRHRGTEGFGLFDGQEGHLVKAAKEDRILNWLVKYPSNLIMFHHRRPTSTVNVKRAAHPISTKDFFGKPQYITIHNGFIYNARDLKKEHEKLGIKYQTDLQDKTFNDSEALAWDIALFLEGKQDNLKVRGKIAFITMKLDGKKLDKMYFGRNSNPLQFYRDEDGLTLSSEGEGEMIKSDTFHTWNYKLNRLTKRRVIIPEYAYQVENKEDTRNKNGWNWDNKNSRVVHTQQTRIRDDLDVPDYDDYGDTQSIGSILGNKIGGWLAKKTNKYERNLPANNVDYIHDPKTQMLIPADTREEDDEKIIESYLPGESEIQNLAKEYLISVAGHFEQAYWALEVDYDKLLSEKETKENIRLRLLFEATMEFIETDPENTGQEAVSTICQSMWQQQVGEEVKTA